MSNISSDHYSKRAELERLFHSSHVPTVQPQLSSTCAQGCAHEMPHFYKVERPSTKSGFSKSIGSLLISLTAASLFTGAGVATSFMNGHGKDFQLEPSQPSNIQQYPWAFGFNPHTAEGAAQIHERLQQGTVNVPKSTITGIVDASSMSASLYWTLLLKNNNSENKEAAFEIDLPKNSAVSRATLWINGVAQEAAFSSNEAVKNAYDSIVVRNRDPLLITQIGPNKIKVLASPVTANGGEMQLRIGLTAPIQSNDRGSNYLELPRIVKSNMKFDSKQDVHISSDTKISGLGTTEDTGFYLLRANVSADELKNAKIDVGGALPQRFATRLMHTSPAEYVISDVRDGRRTLTRVKYAPDCKIVMDQDVVSRISNLWAHQEIERLVSRGQNSEACELANIFRIVSSVSGAVVLEQEYDYSNNGLNRDMNRTIGNPPTPQQSFDAFGNASGAEAPMLQGATNGTIGPQGSDATVIMGVNTSGTVYVRNLAILEVSLHYLSILWQFVGVALAVFLSREAVHRNGAKLIVQMNRVQALVIALIVGVTGVFAPTWMNMLIAAARDANIFS
jgi:hypothetical protein